VKCGGVCPPNLQSQGNRNLQNIAAAVFAFLLVPIICVFCSRCGNSPKTPVTNADFSNQATNKQNEKPANAVSLKQTLKKDGKSNPKTGKKSAVVISENANLRTSPEIAGDILTEIPESSEITVIKQKGAWFQIKYNNQTGWIHGNTIRLNEDVSDLKSDIIENNLELPKTTGYYTGPRGGCYTYSSSGKKRYVDHSYCD
jgi:hypothetical protein